MKKVAGHNPSLPQLEFWMQFAGIRPSLGKHKTKKSGQSLSLHYPKYSFISHEQDLLHKLVGINVKDKDKSTIIIKNPEQNSI